MSERKVYLVGDAGELPLSIRALLDMLRHTQEATLHAVQGLTVAQLDHRHDAQSNSIGMLLWHMAAVEAWYQVHSFEDRPWGEADAAQWDVALHLGDAAAAHHGHPLEFYVGLLQTVRARTERELRARDEAWLLRIAPLAEDADANHYWRWFHVCEDQIGHTAQIRWVRKRLPSGETR